MAITGYPDLELYLRELGKAVAYVGDPFTANGLVPLGATEGDVTVAANAEMNNLTFPEETGPAVHEARVQGENPVITLPLIIGNPALWAQLSPDGTTGGGFKSPQRVVDTSLVLFPVSEIEDGLAYPALGPWAPAAPVHALWFWRVYFNKVLGTFRQADGGKVIETVTAQVMYDKARPDGQRLYTRGDPAAKGITSIII